MCFKVHQTSPLEWECLGVPQWLCYQLWPYGSGCHLVITLWVGGPSRLMSYPVWLIKELLKCLGMSELIGEKWIKITYPEILNHLQNKPGYYPGALVLGYPPTPRGNREQKAVATFLLTEYFCRKVNLVKVECIQEIEPRWLKRYLRFPRSARPGSDCRPCQMDANDLGAEERLQRALVNWR